MDASTKLAAFVQPILEQLRSRPPDYDWKPTVEPPRDYERRLKPCPPPDFTPPVGDIDQARQIIREAIQEYLSMPYPAHILLIKSLPGTGKTTLAVEAVDALAASGRRIAYAGPRHSLYQDVTAKSIIPREWYEWLPRQAENPDDGTIQTCNYVSQITEWMNKGYQAMDFCAGVCRWDYVNDGCVYHAQKKRGERVIYVQHQHVTLGHPLDFSVLFGDESPLSAFTREWRIPSRWILPPGMDLAEPLTEVLSLMASVAGSTDRAVSGPELLEYLGGAEAVSQACESYQIPTGEIAAAGSIYRAEDVEYKPYFHLFDLVPLLLREARQAQKGIAYPHRMIVSPGFLTLLLRRTPDPKDMPFHVVWLDATGRPEIYKRIFKRDVQVVDATPRLYGKIYQVVDRANGKSAVLKDGQRTAKAKQAETVIQKIIQDQGYRQPSIISYKDFVENTEIQARTGHFYAARGTNEHEDADAIFILGAPQANIYDVVKMAKMIYFERDIAFRVEWVTREATYNHIAPDGQGRSYPVSGFWNDPDLQAVLETIREDEIIQAAHRGRPVNHPVDIWLFTNIPIGSLPPDELLTMRDVMGAPDGVDIFKWEKVQRLMSERDAITISDIVDLGIHYDTASRYLDLITKEPGWELAAVKSRRGKPTKMASRSNNPE